VLALLWPGAQSHAQWTTAPSSAPGVLYRTFASATAGTTVSFHVWLPPQYDTPGSKQRFPVLYDLVGFTGSGLSHTAWKPRPARSRFRRRRKSAWPWRSPPEPPRARHWRRTSSRDTD